MALNDNIVWAFTPRRASTGYMLLDRGRSGTHLAWVSPIATNWEADSAGIVVPSFNNSNDYAAASQQVPAKVTSFSVIHWVKLRQAAAGFINSIDGNFGTTNNGPRLEHTTTSSWVYNGGTGSTVISSGSTIAVGTWAMYAITHDGNVTAKTYNQGRLTGATQSNLSGATGSFTGVFGAINIGRGLLASRGYTGNVGGTIILGRQLADAEVWWIYNAGPACSWATPYRRRTYGFVAAGFKPYWSRQRAQLIGGGV